MVRAFSAFLDFCYLVRRSVFTAATLAEIDLALARFHRHREVFRRLGVRPTGFSLPRQHSMKHYTLGIMLFGSPNGLCTSITESKHIKAVKEPYRRSSRHNALGQMLLTNQRLEKLAASRADFASRGMLEGSFLPMVEVEGDEEDGVAEGDESMRDAEDVSGPRIEAFVTMALTRRMSPLLPKLALLILRAEQGYPRDVVKLGEHIGHPELIVHIRRFLYDQLHPDGPLTSNEVPIQRCPHLYGRINVFHSAVATYYAPSDLSGEGGMHRERIRAAPHWWNGRPRYDTVFLDKDSSLPGLRGLYVARVRLFFSFTHKNKCYPCALVEWFLTVGDQPDDLTGLWIVEPDIDDVGRRVTSVIHLDSIVRAAHLLPVFGKGFLPVDFDFSYSLDAFRLFYVNKYADHHANEIAF